MHSFDLRQRIRIHSIREILFVILLKEITTLDFKFISYLINIVMVNGYDKKNWPFQQNEVEETQLRGD